MYATDTQNEADLDKEESDAKYKLDLGYFTEANRCPLMVQRGARSAFELFLYIAHRFLVSNGEPVLAEHEPMCAACGLQPDSPHSRSSISRLLRLLRETFHVIEYQPVQRRRPQIRLAPARPGADVLNPRHYVFFYEDWSKHRRTFFDTLGSHAFCTEYMYWIAKYESALARVKHKRAYWFFPLEKISTMFHISTRFAGVGLRGLVKLGVMRVAYGQYGLHAPNNEFAAANRYYFEGMGEIQRREGEFELIEHQYKTVFKVAHALAAELTNGSTIKNVQGLCELIATYGENRVRTAIENIAITPPRSLKRRLAYIKALVLGRD